MKSKLSMVVGFVVLSGGSAAFAQVTNTTTGVGAGAAPAANVDVTLTGNITSSVELRVDGTFTTSNSTSGAVPATATVDFGTFSTTTPTSATADYAGRATSGTAGAFVATDISARLTFSGSTTGDIQLERANAAGAGPDVPAGNLRYGGAAQTWGDVSTDGTAIADPGSSIYVCGGPLVATTCTNTQDYDHQLAIFIPDTQAAGAFTTVVTYIGTAP